MGRFQIYLIKPTKYDDDGYPLQWWRSLIPSNSLACVAGIVRDSLARGALGAAEVDVHILDEMHDHVDPRRIARAIDARGGHGFIALVGVQTNQYPRALDLARAFRAARLPVAIGGFHVSGCISMLRTLPPELVEARALGIALFAGEAEEGRMDAVLVDAFHDRLQPVYDHLKATPGLEGAPIPLLPKEHIARNAIGYSSFDLGRGCPFECSFCTIINVQGRKSRFRTPDDLEAIIRTNAANGIDRFFITDDNFARNRNWEAFCDRLIALRETGVRVKLILQIDTLAYKIPHFIEKCVAAGVEQVFIGLENINADNLEAANKKQNRVEDYKTMFLAWKRYPVLIICGYIIGFPNDTYDSIMHDVELIKRELAVDVLYFTYLTPLPGSADHRALHEAGIWMDPDLSKYDLTHRVTHHPRMTDTEWERAYRDAYRSYYTWEHMARVLRRMIALRSSLKLTTANRLFAYREAMRLEDVSALESGLFRIRRRHQRRPTLPIESAIAFYARVIRHTTASMVQGLGSYARLRWMLARALRDPNRLTYRDAAIVDQADEAGLGILAETRTTERAERRRARLAA